MSDQLELTPLEVIQRAEETLAHLTAFKEEWGVDLGKLDSLRRALEEARSLPPHRKEDLAEVSAVIINLRWLLLHDVPTGHREPLSQQQTPWLGRWGFLAYLLSRKARREVFEPAWQELLEDYVVACGEYPTQWQRRSIKGIFAWRAVCLGWQCVRAVVGDRLIQFLERLAPQLVRWWLTR